MEFSAYDFIHEYEEREAKHDKYRWLLGIRYTDEEEEQFLKDFGSIIWCSYRKDFPQMNPYPYTSDRGWGCMLRAAQMILAQGLCRHKFERGWRVPADVEERKRNEEFCKLLEWFVDHKEDGPLECLFSLHTIVQCGMRYDMLPGEWYGPSNAIKVIRDLVQHAEYKEKMGGKIAFVVCDGGSIYKQKIDEECDALAPTTEEKQNDVPSLKEEHQANFCDPLLNPPPSSVKNDQDLVWRKSLLLFLPLRLGINNVNLDYQKGLIKTFEFPQSLGIIGGRPNHAIYFVGYDDNSFLGLDPHTVQPSPDPNEFPSTSYLLSVHRERPQVMPIDCLDPSLALGFYCRDRNDFLDLCQNLASINDDGDCAVLPISIAHAPSSSYDNLDIEDFDEGTHSDIEDEFVIIEKHI
mmetsp:Transcript_10432/g.13520  ORF Transcript_10432/g.13520 Transcript_10432/m.13520 type:complete len:407 (-) Transcript_10432:283-1503(-)